MGKYSLNSRPDKLDKFWNKFNFKNCSPQCVIKSCSQKLLQNRMNYVCSNFRTSVYYPRNGIDTRISLLAEFLKVLFFA